MKYTIAVIEDSKSFYYDITNTLKTYPQLNLADFGDTTLYSPSQYLTSIHRLSEKPHIFLVDYDLEWSNDEYLHGETIASKILELYSPNEKPCIIFISHPKVNLIKEALYKYKFFPGIWTAALDKTELSHDIAGLKKTKFEFLIDEAVAFLRDRNKNRAYVDMDNLYMYPDLKDTKTLELKLFRQRGQEPILKRITPANFVSIFTQTGEGLISLFLYEDGSLEKYLKTSKKDTLKTLWSNRLTLDGIENLLLDTICFNSKYFTFQDEGLTTVKVTDRHLKNELITQFMFEERFANHPFKKVFSKIIIKDRVL